MKEKVTNDKTTKPTTNMKKIMKALALASAMLPLCAGAQEATETTVATETMYVVKTDKSVAAYPVKDVDRVVYSESDILPSYTSCPDTCHPHAIDLGLPSGTKWACCNVGATKPEDYGNYYAWGETTTKTEYSTSNTTNSTAPDDIQATEYDAARANLGLPWMMPTKAQAEELVNKCTWTYDSTKKGYKVTSNTTQGNIWMPAAGFYSNDQTFSVGVIGEYWSSMRDVNTGYYDVLYINASSHKTSSSNYRFYGMSVRAVCP